MTRYKQALTAKPLGANSLIHGDNADVLARLLPDYRDQVRCIYMDPPYNGGERHMMYSDKLGHDEWLEELGTILELCEELLEENGSIWISIDDEQMHYLKVLADGVFGRENFLATIVWEHRTSRENRRAFSHNHEYLLAYAKNAKEFRRSRNRLPASGEILARYKNPDNDPRGAWQSISAHVQAGHATPSQFYDIVGPGGRIHRPPKGRCWAYAEPKMLAAIKSGDIWFGRNGAGVPRIKRFLRDVELGVTPETLWTASSVGTTTDAKRHVLELFPDETVFDTPKPEGLIERILHIATDEGDLVIDPYLGSGTTAAVAHKMGRKWIGIEIGEHAVSHCKKRLDLVLEGERGGISSHVGWTGGGHYAFVPGPVRAVAAA